MLVGEPFRRTHDLDDLVSRLLPLYPAFAKQAADVRHISVWGVAYRYPGLEDVPEPLPAEDELRAMVKLLQEFHVAACRIIVGE